MAPADGAAAAARAAADASNEGPAVAGEPAAGDAVAGQVLIGVEVVYCPQPHAVDLTPLQLPAGTRAGAALDTSGVLQRHGLDATTLSLGIWGRACGLDQPLRDRDRLELYRPLQVDPKEARRLRYMGKRAR